MISLNLQGLKVSSSCLNRVIKNLTHLTYLNLSSCSGCTDSVLENLAKHCPNMKKLILESCTGITDGGIEALLKSADTDSLSESLKIVSLNVSSTSVTTASLWLLLAKLPVLLRLAFAGIRAVAGCGKFINNKISQLNLQHLDMLSTPMKFNQLKQVLESCQNLIELKFTVQHSDTNVENKPLSESFTHLSKLKILHISVDQSALDSESPPPPFSFEQFVTFLPQIGHQLESLSLTGPLALRLYTLCIHCTSLKELILYDCRLLQPFLLSLEISPKEQFQGDIEHSVVKLSDFLTLQRISLEKIEFKDISLQRKQELLYQLLVSHHHLRHLSLRGIPIEAEILIKVLQSSSAVQLETLALSCYDNITVKTIRKIEECCPNLKRLELLHCWDMNWYDIWQINDHLRGNGKELEVVAKEQNHLI